MKRSRSGESGTVLVAAMVVVAFLAVVSVAALNEATSRSAGVEASSASRQGLLVAESGLATAMMELNRRTSASQAVDGSNDGMVGTDAWSSPADADGNGEPDFGEAGVAPVALTGGEYITHTIALGSDGLDNDNDGVIDGPSEQPFMRVISKARMDGRAEVREVTAVVRSMAAGPHPIFSGDYAIYAGNSTDMADYEMRFGGQAGASRSETRYQCVNCGYMRSSSFSMCPKCGRYRCKYCGATGTYRYRCRKCQKRNWRTGISRKVVIEVPGENHADYVCGKIHANGDIKFTGHAEVADLDDDGDHTDEVSATGKITGGGILGAADAGAIAPPDIKAMDYDHIADFVVSRADPPAVKARGCYGYCTTYPADDPRHIFTDQDYRSDLGFLQDHHDNRNYFFADVREGNNDGDISISPEGNDSIYYVDGNLWIEAGAYHYRFHNPPSDGARMTVVVRGNVYVCDDFWLGYSRSPSPSDTPEPISQYTENGLALIAISDGESYVDTNSNFRYDPGEMIVNDDGVPGYQGVQEGSGNIYYGDPNTGPVGDSQVFFYAENDFVDYCLAQDGKPLDFGVQGLMSAGNQVRINRDFGGQHARMVVQYDPRLSGGELELPGLPRATSESVEPLGPWAVVSWRERLVTGPWM